MSSMQHLSLGLSSSSTSFLQPVPAFKSSTKSTVPSRIPHGRRGPLLPPLNTNAPDKAVTVPSEDTTGKGFGAPRRLIRPKPPPKKSSSRPVPARGLPKGVPKLGEFNPPKSRYHSLFPDGGVWSGPLPPDPETPEDALRELMKFARQPHAFPLTKALPWLSKTREHIERFDNGDLCQLVWACGKTFRKTNFNGELMELCKSTAGWALKVLQARDKEGQGIRQTGSVSICMLMLGLAWVKVHPPHPFCDAIAKEVIEKLPQYNTQGYSNLAYAFAKLEYNPLKGAMIEAMMNDVMKNGRYKDFSAQSIANFMWACVQLKYEFSREALNGFAAHAATMLGEFRPQTYSNFLWAYANYGYDPEGGKLMRKIVEHLTQLQAQNKKIMAEFRPSHASGLLWAMAQLQYRPPNAFLDMMADKAMDRLDQWIPRDFSSLAHALAKLDYSPFENRFFDVMVKQVKRMLLWDGWEAREIVTWFWGLTSVGYKFESGMMDHVAFGSLDLISEFQPQTYANLVWAYAKQKYNPIEGRLWEGIVNHLRSNPEVLEKFNEQDISNLMWAASYMDIALPHRFMNAVAKVALEKLDTFSLSSAKSLMLCFANLDFPDPLDGDLAAAIRKKSLDLKQRSRLEAQEMAAETGAANQ